MIFSHESGAVESWRLELERRMWECGTYSEYLESIVLVCAVSTATTYVRRGLPVPTNLDQLLVCGLYQVTVAVQAHGSEFEVWATAVALRNWNTVAQ